MIGSISDWLRRTVLNTKKQDVPQVEGELPALPPQRLRRLTPTPSRESLAGSVRAATANSFFFQHVPPELRRQILIEAFGGRILHMDLRFEQPQVYLTEKEIRAVGDVFNVKHCGMAGKRPFLHSQPKLDTSKLPSWQWFGCVCHRDPEARVRGWSDDGLVSEPWTDLCRGGGANSCRDWAGEKPGKCWIGVMGWLLSCRQAYVEVIEVLYSTNIIHMASHPLICHLNTLLLPQRLASIASVEMVWHFHEVYRPARPGDAADTGREAFEALVNALPRSLPNLRSLHISLIGQWYPLMMAPNDRVKRSETDIFVPIDEMVRKLGDLRECNIAVPVSIFRSRWEQGIRKGLRFERGKYAWVSDRIWRPLPTTGEVNDTNGDDRGYWIREGKDDMDNPFAHIVSAGA